METNVDANEVFSVGRSTAKLLERLVASPDEREALERLRRFEGSAADMRSMASTLRRAGEDTAADALIETGDV